MPNLQIIRTLSEQKKITLKSVCEVAGITFQGLNTAINTNDIKFSYLDKIANYLQVDLSVFSDFPPPRTKDEGISVGGDNSGNIAGGNIVKVNIPDAGYQKIIKPDGSVEMETLSSGIAMPEANIRELQEKIELQKQLIKSLQDQVEMYKKSSLS